MALGLTQILTKIVPEIFRGGGGGQRRPVRRADNIYHLQVPIVLKSGNLKACPGL